MDEENADDAAAEASDKWMGGQTIGAYGSTVLNLNNIMGPAMVVVPLLYQKAGWLIATLVLVVVWILSSFAGSMLAESMQRIPGNFGFRKRFEFCTTVQHYFGYRWYWIAQIGVNLCLQALNVASIIVSAQVMDEFFIYFFRRDVAFRYAGGPIGMVVSGSDPGIYVISAGFVFCMLVCLPFGFVNLEDNMGFQWFSSAALVLTVIELNCAFFSRPMHPEWSPAFTTWPKQALVLGVCVFSYSYVVCVPSWINEKKPGVSVNKAVWSASTIGMVMKLSIGLFAAMTFANPDSTANILTVMSRDLSRGKASALGTLTRYCVYLFNFGTIVPGIPVFSILVRYNLLTGGICGPRQAFFWGTVAPWLISLMLYRGPAFASVVNWTALLFQGFVNFVAPAIMYRAALLRYPTPAERRRQNSGSRNRGSLLRVSTTDDDAGAAAAGTGAADDEQLKYGTGSHDHRHHHSAAGAIRQRAAPASKDGRGAGAGAQQQNMKRKKQQEEVKEELPVDAVPDWLADRLGIRKTTFAVGVACTMTLLVVLTIGLDMWFLFVLGKDLVDG